MNKFVEKLTTTKANYPCDQERPNCRFNPLPFVLNKHQIEIKGVSPISKVLIVFKIVSYLIKLKRKNMDFTHFIGVDVSKNELDFAVFNGKEFLFHQEIKNNNKSISSFMKELKSKKISLDNSVFCMEHTGIYNNPLLVYLHDNKGSVCLEAATQIKYSLGNIRGKNDKVDALRIGEYAYKNRDELRLWKPKREVLLRLSQLTTLRDRLINTKKTLKVSLDNQEGFIEKKYILSQEKLCKASLEALKKDLGGVEKAIQQIIKEDENLSRLFDIVTSIQGVGKETAIQMILRTNEFKDIQDPKKFACYAGVAPFPKESGLFKGRDRVSHMANKKMKTLLHLAALTAIVHNQDLRPYYQRKVEEGKNKMSVVNAVRNKLIHRVFTCVNQNRKYEISYTGSLA